MNGKTEDKEHADRRSARAEAQRGVRRETILKAASALFSRQGYHATSVADVIAAAGISRGTFYLYFDNKDSLFLELMEQFIQRIIEVVEVVDAGGPSPTRKIYENVRRVVDVVFDNRDLTVLVLREDVGLNPEVDEKLGRFYGFVREMVEGALENGARVGLIRKINEPIVATALIGAIKEVFLHHLVIAKGTPPSRESVAESLLDFGLRGLLRVPPGDS
ncbi:MAG: TetR/AcrR family transcriptional regulator [Polyangiales bacterium]